MIFYYLARIGGGILTLSVGAIAVFFLMRLAPGDPALVALGELATPEAVASFRAERGLNDPLLVQFVTWFWNSIRGDFGISLSFSGGWPINDLIVRRLPNTLFVGLFAILMAISLSLVLATLAALNRGGKIDLFATGIAVIGISMPDFWLAFLLILVFSLEWNLLPSYGFVSPFESLPGAFQTAVLPAFAIALPMAAVFTRILRSSILETSNQLYTVAARSFGFRALFIYMHYTLRNAMIPYVTIVGLQIRYILGGVVVVERIFGIPGIGSLMVDGAFARDYNVVQACALTFLMLVLITNISIDIICTLLDPRRAR